MLLWRDQCHAAGIDFLISFDRTYVRETHFLEPFTAAELHLYSQEDVEREYPAWRELIQALPRKQLTVPGPGVRQMGPCPPGSMDAPARYGCRSMAWGFHCECVAAAITQAARRKNIDRYDFVWVFEDDVGYSGENIVDFLEKYVSDESDLLTHFYESVPRTWWWRLTMTEAFYQRVGRVIDACVVSPEHVQRFSGRLLAELEAWSRAGAVSWSECMTPTVCLSTDGLRCGVLRAEDAGFPFKWNGKVSAQRWGEICSSSRGRRGISDEGVVELGGSDTEDGCANGAGSPPSGSGKLYHALKF